MENLLKKLDKLLIELKSKLKSLKPRDFILVLIIVLGFIVRFYQLGQVPASFNRDEPAIGYNAYSILKTGKDEWGKSFPLSFKSFGDYKSPLYIYLTVIPIFLFGLTEFSVRFWAALSGTLTVVVIYFFMKQLFKSKEKIKNKEKNNWLALITAFLLAVSPWHIFFSRFSFEAILALLFNLLILYLLLKNNFKKITFSIISLFLFSFLSYSSSLVFWPIFIFVWGIYLLKKVFLNKKKLSFKQIGLFVALLIIVAFIFKSQASISKQKKQVTVLGDPQIALNLYVKRTEVAKESLLKARLFHNQYLAYGKIILFNYFKSFSPSFIFGGGGRHPWHKIPQLAHLYPIFSVLSLLGLFVFIRTDKIKRINKFFLGLFFLLTPIASALTVDAPHATRLLNLFLILIILAGLGLHFLFKRIKLLAILIVLVLVFSFGKFCKFYFIDYRRNPPLDLLPGFKEVMSYLKKEEDKADRIVFDNRNDGAYIYLLFYQAFPPDKFMNKNKRYSSYPVGLEWVERFDQYLFTENPIADKEFREIYVLKGNASLGEKKLVTIEDELNDRVYYCLEANF